jgi:DNA-dependent RNA polymerase
MIKIKNIKSNLMLFSKFLSGQRNFFEVCIHQIKFKYLFKRMNHSISLNNNISNSVLAEQHSSEDINKENNYDISWTKDYKNLNKLLGVKGVNSNKNIDINKIKYLIFSLDSNYLSLRRTGDKLDMDLFYSLRLVISDFNNNNNNNNRLYEKIIYNLKNNSSWIKDGGSMDIYYVTSKNNIRDDLHNKNTLKPSITEVIKLKNSINNKELRVNIFIFSYDSFFREYLSSEYRYFKKDRTENDMLWTYPFLIIEDMNLPTVTYLFKERKINAHGMSITWRHKLSPLEENLSNFLYVTNLNESAQISHLCFSDEVFTSNKIDFNLYKEISLIQEFNFKKKLEIGEKIKSIVNRIEPLSTDTERNKLNLYTKYQNIEKSAINPLVIILLKRNHIFELEKILNDAQGSHKDLLSVYNNTNLEVNNLIKLNNNKQNIIKELNVKINNLELEISKFENKMNKKLLEQNKHKKINKENKIIRKIKIKAAKTKKEKKKIRKKNKTNIVESGIINVKIMRDQNLLKNKINEKEKILDEIISNKKEMFDLKNIIEKKIDDKKGLELNLINSNNKLENISNDINSNSKFSFSKDLVNKFNLLRKNRKNSSNNSDFILKKREEKRKYSTLPSTLRDINDNKFDNSFVNRFSFNDIAINQLFKEIITNPMYVKLTQILNSSVDPSTGISLNNRDKQLQIEETLRFFWNQELQKIFEGKKSLFSNYVGINILMSSISKLDKVLNIFKEDKRYLKKKIYRNHIILAKNGIIVSIVLTNIIPHMMKYRSNQNTATLFKQIGMELHSNLLHNEWCEYNNISKKDPMLDICYSIEQNNNNYKIENGLSKKEFYIRLNDILGIISSDDYFKLGCDLSEIISENSELFKFINVPNEDNTVQRIVVPGKKLEDQIVKLLAIDMDKLVMICEACKWEVTIVDRKGFKIINYGGFLLNSTNKISFINDSYKNNGKTILDDVKIIDCINYLNSIPYTINKQVLNHVFNLFNARESGIYSNNKINELIKLNMHPNTTKLYNLTIKKKYGEITDIYKHNSQYYSDKSVITYALIFLKWCESSDDNSIYFNYFIDWRGRLYTNSTYLSVQGGNLARSLLLFKNGQILTDRGLEHLKIYTANCYGLDKLAYNKRLEWTNNNWNKILSVPFNFNSLSMDQDQIEFYNFVLEADEPWLFLSCCIELKNYELDKKNFKSRLPVYLDATCNGLQHLSTMINDTNLAKYVNITKSNKEDIPNDVYTHMISFVNKKIQEYIKNDNALAILDNININRKFIKPGIMTISYGSTSRGIAEQLKINNFKQLDLVKGKKVTYVLTKKEFNKTDSDIHLTVKQIFVLAKAIHSVLYEVFPNLTILVKYLKDMNLLLKILKLPTIWLTPAGLIIEQNYAPLKKRELETSILGKRKSISITELNRNLTDIRKQNNSIVPNIVHSFDASNIALLVENISSNFKNKKMDLITIHDCFATNSNDVDEMVLKVKLSFIALYSDRSFIEDYHNFILDFIQKTGFVISEISSPLGEINTYVTTDNIRLLIPKVPPFSLNKNLRFDILSSQYFIN